MQAIQMKYPQFLKAYGYSRTTADRWRYRYEDPLPVVKIGGGVYVNIKEYEKWLKRNAEMNV